MRFIRSGALILTIFGALLPFSAGAESGLQKLIGQRWNPLVPFASRAEMVTTAQNRFPDLKFSNDRALENRVREDLAVIDQKYRELFPRLMINKAFPDFIVIDSDDVSDTMVWNPKFSQSGIAFVSKKIYDPTISAAARLGLLAHELAHLYLNHQDVELAVLSVTPQSARQNLEKYVALAEVAGSFALTELHGWPAGDGADLNERVKEFLDKMHETALEKKNSCADEVKTFRNKINDGMRSSLDPYVFDLVLTPAQRKQISNSTLKLIAMTRACYKAVEFDGTVFEQTLRTSLKIHSQLRDLKKKLKGVRWRSFEDEADEFSVAVLRSLNLQPVETMAMLLESFAGVDARKTCFDRIRAGHPIPFGYLSSAHHAVCYRADRAMRLAKDPKFDIQP